MNYKSVYNKGEAIIFEKKSKFIATVSPVKNEGEAICFIDSMKKKYYDANHNVFAYQVGEKNEIQRYSDDGEPSGTAGLPVLDVLRGEQLYNTAIVVTRYFGGTLLGTGGLVRAYGKTAKEGVLSAKIVEHVFLEKFKIVVPYTLSGRVQYELLQKNYIIVETTYTDVVNFYVLVEFQEKNSFLDFINEVTNAIAIISECGSSYYIFCDGKLL